MNPKLRPVEIIPFRQDGQEGFALRDPSGLAEQTLAVSLPVLFILQRLDGRHDVAAIHREFEAAAGFALSREQLEGLLRALDEAHFLEGPGFDAHRAAVVRAYREADHRPPGHAGQAYPSEPAALRDWYFSLDAGDVDFAPSGQLVGAAAPHIDCRFGGASCRVVHEQIARRRGDLDTLVVLGTGHCAGEDLFTLTRQRYATPMRVLETDVELVDALDRRLSDHGTRPDPRSPLFAAEILHKREHSVEFQALFADLAAEGRTPPRLLPVLVGSFHEFMDRGVEPYSDARVRGFVAAVREEAERLSRRVAIVASIDLSHLGPRYGDAKGLSREEAARVEIADRELLRFAEDGDAEGFFFHNQAAKDERRVCGFSALYTLLRLLPGARGTLLRYEQTTFPHTEDTVAHCAMVFERDEDGPGAEAGR